MPIGTVTWFNDGKDTASVDHVTRFTASFALQGAALIDAAFAGRSWTEQHEPRTCRPRPKPSRSRWPPAPPALS